MLGPVKRLAKHIVRLKHRSHTARALADIARRYLMVFMNEWYWDIEGNGEGLVIRRVFEHSNDDPFVAIDVGANIGDWTLFIKKVAPESRIHCFEISKEIFPRLSARLSEVAGATINCMGLSDKDGTVDFKRFPDEENLNNLDGLDWSGEFEITTCRVMKGSDYLTSANIDRVDLLKIDTEGHDLRVLKGFAAHLGRGAITAIQFEYGVTCIPSRTLLADFYQFLEPMGYAVGRLYPTGVLFKKYDPFTDEHFMMGNYVAVHESNHSLLRRMLDCS